MGFNTGILILNDAWHQITEDPITWWNDISEASHRLPYEGDRCYVDVRAGNHVNGSSVFHMSHADTVGVYALGGNCVSQLLRSPYNGGHHHTQDDRISLLQEMASELGYRLVRKSATNVH